MKLSEYYNIIRNKVMIKKVQGKVYLSDISLISMNCIGGTFYHDMNCKFLTPTVNLFFTASDFIKFVNDLDYYLSFTPVVEMGEKYPIGTLVEIMGDKVNPKDIATYMGTIVYELLAQLNGRIPRIYLQNNEEIAYINPRYPSPTPIYHKAR